VAGRAGRRLLVLVVRRVWFVVPVLGFVLLGRRLGFRGRGSKAAGSPGYMGDMVAVVLPLLQERSPRSVHRDSLSGKTLPTSGLQRLAP
jgi:hypothetical protein